MFDTVEIDSTWYRYPSKGTVMGWLKYSPSQFVFTAKIPRLITHNKKLGLKSDIQADLDSFFDLMRPLQLGGKLGCLLIQLPPSYDYDLESLQSFLEKLDPQFRFAIEFRHLSWMREETWHLLSKYKIAYANVDEPLLPPEVHVTTDFAYFRWHGKGKRPWYNYQYSSEELDQWIPKLEAAAEKVKKVYGYFNNHFHGNAPKNCLQLIEKLGLSTETQKRKKKEAASEQAALSKYFQTE